MNEKARKYSWQCQLGLSASETHGRVAVGGVPEPHLSLPPGPSSSCSLQAPWLVTRAAGSEEHQDKYTAAVKSFSHPFFLLEPPNALSTCPLWADDLASHSTGKTEENQRELHCPAHPWNSIRSALCFPPATVEEGSPLLSMWAPPQGSGQPSCPRLFLLIHSHQHFSSHLK